MARIKNYTGKAKYYWAGLSTDTRPIAATYGDIALETDTGDEYEWLGSSWLKVVTAGAKKIVRSHPDGTLAIAGGEVAGHTYFNQFGRISDIDIIETPADIVNGFKGLYVPPTAARIHQIKSTSAQDIGAVRASGTITTTNTATDKTTVIDSNATFITDNVAIGDPFINDTAFDHSCVESIVSETELTLVGYHDGQVSTAGDTYRIVNVTGTGTAIVHIKKGIGSDGYFAGEFVILNGTTNVPTTKTYWRINRIHADGQGSNDVNVGTITATADTDATVTATISIGVGQSQMAFDTVPRGSKGYITNYYLSIGRQSKTSGAMADCAMSFRKFITANCTGKIQEHNISCAVDGTSKPSHNFNPYKIVKELTDVWLTIEGASDNAVYYSAGFDIIEVAQ